MPFWKRKITEVGVVIALCTFLLWWNPVSLLTPVRSFLWVAFEPIALFSIHMGRGVGDFFESFARIASLQRENTELVLRVSELSARVADLEDMRIENEHLRKEISAAKREGERVALALIVGYDAQGVGDWILIDKGREDGVEPGMTVVHGENVLVGTIEESLSGTAKVRLMSHPKSVFNVHTVETQAKGVARGEFGLGVLLDAVLQTETLREGDSVVTSPLGEQYPPGLFVGTVGTVGVSDDGLFQQAAILPSIDIFAVKTVSIIR